MANEKFETKIRKAEDEYRPKIELAHRRYADVLALLPKVTNEYDATSAQVARISSSWATLADDYTPEDYSLAQAAQVRARQRVRGARDAYRKAERGRRGLRTNLAEVAAQVMRRALPGVTVLTSFAPLSATPRADELPLALVTQEDLPETNSLGAEKGKVAVTYYYTQIHSGLPSTAAIEQAAQEVGADVRCLDSGRGGRSGSGVARVALEVVDRPELPFHETVAESHHGRVAAVVSAAVAQALTPGSDTVRNDVASGLCQSGRISVAPGETRGSETIDKDGRRTVAIESAILLETTGAFLGTADDVSAAVSRAVETLPGLHVMDLGKVERAEVIDESDLALSFEQVAGRLRATEATAGMSRHSRPTSEAPWRGMNAYQFIFRATVVSTSAPYAQSDEEAELLVTEIEYLAEQVERRARWDVEKFSLLEQKENAAERAAWARDDAARGLA